MIDDELKQRIKDANEITDVIANLYPFTREVSII